MSDRGGDHQKADQIGPVGGHLEGTDDAKPGADRLERAYHDMRERRDHLEPGIDRRGHHGARAQAGPRREAQSEPRNSETKRGRKKQMAMSESLPVSAE